MMRPTTARLSNSLPVLPAQWDDGPAHRGCGPSVVTPLTRRNSVGGGR